MEHGARQFPQTENVMYKKPVLVEIAIFIVTGILFIMLMFKINSYAKAERNFQLQMMRDCLRNGGTTALCEKMAVDGVWRY